MKLLYTFLMVLACAGSAAQQKTIDLVEAERAFSRYAIEHNTKEAFLRFMDTGAVVFDDGLIKKAKETWEAKQADTRKLSWEPSIAAISTAGDLGITSGGWTLKAGLVTRDSILASGEFMTVWKKVNGEWKWIVDIGAAHNQKLQSPNVTSIELNHIERTGYDAQRYMLMAEQNLITGYARNGKETFKSVADNDIYLIAPGQLPVQGIYNLDAALTEMSGGIQFLAAGSGTSKDGDIGYVYGYATENGKKGNYLRIWRRVGRKWTLLMQAITI